MAVDYIESARVSRVSRFRSAAGHDSSDEFETPPGRRFVSWFDVMTDSLFQRFQLRGVATRDSLIISRSARDADPLTCDPDGGFTSFGTVTSWVDLP